MQPKYTPLVYTTEKSLPIITRKPIPVTYLPPSTPAVSSMMNFQSMNELQSFFHHIWSFCVFMLFTFLAIRKATSVRISFLAQLLRFITTNALIIISSQWNGSFERSFFNIRSMLTEIYFHLANIYPTDTSYWKVTSNHNDHNA